MSLQDWETLNTWAALKEICERNGFKFFRGYNGEIKIIARDVCVFKAESFKEALAFMKGYEQHIMETKNNDK